MYGALDVRLFSNKRLNVDLKNIEIWVFHGLKRIIVFKIEYNYFHYKFMDKISHNLITYQIIIYVIEQIFELTRVVVPISVGLIKEGSWFLFLHGINIDSLIFNLNTKIFSLQNINFIKCYIKSNKNHFCLHTLCALADSDERNCLPPINELVHIHISRFNVLVHIHGSPLRKKGCPR